MTTLKTTFPTSTLSRENGGRIELVTYSNHWCVRVWNPLQCRPLACHTGKHSNDQWKKEILARYK